MFQIVNFNIQKYQETIKIFIYYIKLSKCYIIIIIIKVQERVGVEIVYSQIK